MVPFYFPLRSGTLKVFVISHPLSIVLQISANPIEFLFLLFAKAGDRSHPSQASDHRKDISV